MLSSFKPPYPSYDPTDTSGFSYETVVKRWPVIITGVIDQLHNVCHLSSLEIQDNLNGIGDAGSKEALSAKINEGTAIIAKLSKLKYEMGRDHPLDPIIQDGESHIETYNEILINLAEHKKNTWFTAPWLYAECYLYRLIRSFFVQMTHWTSYDPFSVQKLETFKNSWKSILQIATTMNELDMNAKSIKSKNSNLRIIFAEMIQMCLWGNATDLSLLTHLSPKDIEHLQAVGKAAQTERQRFILRDDQEDVWKHVSSLSGQRIDIVLDNAGFELYTDLVFADFLVTFTPFVSKVVFHPKLIPWFVSDVTPPDFLQTLASLSDPLFFGPSSESTEHLREMVSRWQKYIEEGIFSLSVPIVTPLGGSESSELSEFWTTPHPYWNMETQDPSLFKWLRDSALVVFKGDLNYRKLTGDIRWPSWTSFAEALGPIAGSFPLLSLRTNKADIVVGIEKSIASRLDESGERWRVDGRYGLISFLPSNNKN